MHTVLIQPYTTVYSNFRISLEWLGIFTIKLSGILFICVIDFWAIEICTVEALPIFIQMTRGTSYWNQFKLTSLTAVGVPTYVELQLYELPTLVHIIIKDYNCIILLCWTVRNRVWMLSPPYPRGGSSRTGCTRRCGRSCARSQRGCPTGARGTWSNTGPMDTQGVNQRGILLEIVTDNMW